MHIYRPGARVSHILMTGLLVGALVSLTPIAGVAEQPAMLGKAFELRGGQTVTIDGAKLLIRVTAVRDTRCPANPGIACYWKGNAVVRLVVVKLPNGAPARVGVNTYGSGKYPRGARTHGYAIRLVKLTPRPVAAEKPGPLTRIPVKLKDYRITLLVRKS